VKGKNMKTATRRKARQWQFVAILRENGVDDIHCFGCKYSGGKSDKWEKAERITVREVLPRPARRTRGGKK